MAMTLASSDEGGEGRGRQKVSEISVSVFFFSDPKMNARTSSHLLTTTEKHLTTQDPDEAKEEGRVEIIYTTGRSLYRHDHNLTFNKYFLITNKFLIESSSVTNVSYICNRDRVNI